jgi:hypothetical protein
MSLKDRITADMKTAMKAGDRDRLGVIRMALAAIKQREVDERRELTEADVLAAIEKMVKQRRESVSQYESGGRSDLAAKENFEIGVLSEYLPEPLSDDELAALIDAAIAETGAESLRDMGKVMAKIRDEAQGRTDMGAVSARVKARLAG